MEHTTEFLGHIDIAPALNEDEIGYLTAVSASRRFRWAPCWTGCCLTFDGSERCSEPVAWLRYVIAHLLKPGASASRSGPGPVRELHVRPPAGRDGRRLPARYEGADRDHGAREPGQHAHAAGAGPPARGMADLRARAADRPRTGRAEAASTGGADQQRDRPELGVPRACVSGVAARPDRVRDGSGHLSCTGPRSCRLIHRVRTGAE